MTVNFPLPSIIYLQQIYIYIYWEYGRRGERGGFTSNAGVLLSPMNRYHIKDVWTVLKLILMIEHMKIMQMLYLDIRSMLLYGQVPYRTNPSQLFWNGLFQKKNKQGVWRHTFLKKSLELLLFFSVALESPGEIKLHPWKFRKIMYVTYLGNFKTKKSRPLEILHEFFLVSLGSSTFFLINLWNFCILFYEYAPGNSISLPFPLVRIFSGLVQSQRPCISSNTFLYSRMKITYHQ